MVPVHNIVHFGFLNLYGKRKELESSGLQFWKDEIISYKKITCKNWSDLLCGLKGGYENLQFFFYKIMNHRARGNLFFVNNNYTIDPRVIQI